MKRRYNLLLLVLCIFSLLCYSSASSYALETVEAFENNVRATWHNSGDRVSQLKADKAKIVGNEDNFAALYGVKKSDIYRLVAAIDFAISNYIKIKEEVKNSTPHFISTATLENMVKNTTEENTLMLFFDFIEAYANFSDLLKEAVEDKTRVSKLLDANEKKHFFFENAYNTTGEDANYDTNQYTKQSFDFNVARLELENYLLIAHFAQLHLNSLDHIMKNYEKTMEKILSFSKEMATKIDKETIDASFLDSEINGILSYYTKTYETLRDDTILGFTQEELAILPKEFVQLLQNIAQAEKKYILAIYDDWIYFPTYWHTLLDIYCGKTPISVTENLTEQIRLFNEHTNNIFMNLLLNFYSTIAKIESENIRNDIQDVRYKQIALKFKERVADLKQRYLSYVRLHSLLKSQYSMLEISIQMLRKNAGDKALKSSLRKKHFNEFLRFELFNIAHRPITVKKIAKTLLIILYAYLVIFLLKKAIRRLEAKKRVAGGSSYLINRRLILEKTVALIVYVVAFLCILTELNVPLTAFAYMGGIGAVAIGFGTQTIFANLFSGLILIYGDKIRIGDWVIVDNTLGRVENITAQNTLIAYYCFTEHMIVPNSLMLKDTVRNVTRADGLVGDSFEVTIEDIHDLNRGIAAIYRKKDTVKELLPNYFFAAWSGEISGVAKLRPSIIVTYTYDVRLITAGRFKAIMRKAVYDALIEEGLYDPNDNH